jgi:hypothetical protein
LAFGNRAAMTAGVAPNAIVIEFLVEVALAHSLVDDFAKSRHRKPLEIILRSRVAWGGRPSRQPALRRGLPPRSGTKRLIRGFAVGEGRVLFEELVGFLLDGKDLAPGQLRG